MPECGAHDLLYFDLKQFGTAKDIAKVELNQSSFVNFATNYSQTC
jgi:hypothetical protein